MTERRRHPRQRNKGNPAFPVIWFEVEGEFASLKPEKADVVDISQSGIGLSTQIRLEPGQVLKFNKAKKLEGMLPESGRVVWTSEAPDGFKAGVIFAIA